MSEFWDERYSLKEFVFGKIPNEFFKKEISNLPKGRLLLPAEGEGRNAVYAAKSGWKVKAFDQSFQAKIKASELARENKVKFDYELASASEFSSLQNYYDCIALIYVHFNDLKRQIYHKKLINYLKPGGKLILEAFSKDQINYNSGGPKDYSMLFSKEELSEDFASLNNLNIEECIIELEEGNHHKGKAAVIRLTGIK